VGVSEFDGSIYNPKGIDPNDLLAYKKKHGGVKGYPDVKYYEDDAALYEPCDVFIPAAFEQTINKNTAPRLQCKVSSLLAERYKYICIFFKNVNFCSEKYQVFVKKISNFLL
jgi:glutamate dehydrogenase/leucine dehydrogenase